MERRVLPGGEEGGKGGVSAVVVVFEAEFEQRGASGVDGVEDGVVGGVEGLKRESAEF